MGNWNDVLPLVELTYNNNYHSSIGMAPYEALYGRRCRTPLCWYQDGEAFVLGPQFLQQTTSKIKLIQDRMRATQNRQKSYADKRRRPLEFNEGDHVFLRVTPTTGIGRVLKSRKLTLRFIGPYQITRRIEAAAYEIALPPHLSNLHNVFHVSVEEIHCKSRSCFGVRWGASTRGSDYDSWTGSHIGYSGQATERQGVEDGEGPLGRGNLEDDLGDGGSHEEVLSSPLCW